MKKILHLICNSHIDPVWQWNWNEGASAALATFYAACNLLDKYDYVFCHNEVLVYQYVEKYDPELFERIKKLIEEGKWKVMGGWYVQPDCMVPSGESFIRQVSLGREYFGEKFGQYPRVAVNVDSFGHSRGIASVLAKCGYDAYLIGRPHASYVHPLVLEKDLPHGPFIWEGYDGSRIKCFRFGDPYNGYTAPLGHAKEAIEKKIELYGDLDTFPALWGVGNHGGVNSEKDLEDIMILQDEKKGEYEIIHSSLEDYFDSVSPSEVERRQFYVFLKSYSSVSAVKMAHDQLENTLYFAEKICSAADIAGKYPYDRDIFQKAEEILCQIEFHDVLSGTAIKSGTYSSIRKAHEAIEMLREEIYGAFVGLARDLPKVKPNDENIVFFNPYPYDYDGLVEAEFYPAFMPSNCMTKKIVFTPYDMEGKPIEFQRVVPESNIRTGRSNKLIMRIRIPAYQAYSVGVHCEETDLTPCDYNKDGDEVIVSDTVKTVKISRKTGLLTSFNVNGKEYLSSPAFGPYMFNDNEDPWGWRISGLTHNTFSEYGWPQPERKSTLSEIRLDKSSKGLFEGLRSVNVIEDGKMLTEVQCLFSKGENHIVVNYRIFHDTPYVDVNYHVIWNAHGKGLKIRLPLNGESKYFAQMAFGIEHYKNNTVEYPMSRYVGNMNKGDAVTLYNNGGVHSVSKIGKSIYVTLLNGSAYAAHPLEPNLHFVYEDRFTDYCEEGQHDFSFRFMVNRPEECEKHANEFNCPIYNVYHFPHGDGNTAKDLVRVSNSNVIVSAFKKRKDGTYLIRLYNGYAKSASTELSVRGLTKHVSLKKYEFRTYVYDGKSIRESKDASIY